ncbi:phosphatase PAP2 family protein [Ideonella sp. 4Y11]|uniref:Phosphatase PAP2 family protein n=1 Tax=Ideonella aquatica TaxID=2824119 RepID=A0A940YNT8_9BURK|nr:phosphatase PAP2 family protein [Ideonella aquatica]MBQ0960292.1 phosphatase PAP2 family protein [Ideonella aquatica]
MFSSGIGGHHRRPGVSVSDHAAEHLAAAAARLTSGVPWRGHDPDWVYAGNDDALLAEAINRSNARIVGALDPRQESVDPARIASPVCDEGCKAGSDTALWRWGAEPQALTVLSDLSWRFRVKGACLYAASSFGAQEELNFQPSIKLFLMKPEWQDEQIDKVLRAAIEREDRLPEILSQADDFMPFFYSVVGIHPEVAPITCAMLVIAQRWATMLVMAFKHQLAARRPHVTSSRILPVIDTPAHGSLPSGHATVSAMVSALLSRLVYGAPTRRADKVMQLNRLARRIAFNRVVAGVHFPIDSRAGHALGLQLAAHFVGLATDGDAPTFFEEGGDKQELRELGAPNRPPALNRGVAAPQEPRHSPLLATMWRASERELTRLGF